MYCTTKKQIGNKQTNQMWLGGGGECACYKKVHYVSVWRTIIVKRKYGIHVKKTSHTPYVVDRAWQELNGDVIEIKHFQKSIVPRTHFANHAGGDLL